MALCALSLTTIGAQASLRAHYQHTYVKVDKRNAGPYKGGVAGRNLAEDGVLTKHGPRAATAAELRDSLGVMERMLNPPEPVAVPSESVAPTPAPVTVAPTSGAPVDINCESGGDYSINTGNGYYGAYQFDSSTWDAYGDPAYAEANDAPPAVQDAAAASVPYDAWPNC